MLESVVEAIDESDAREGPPNRIAIGGTARPSPTTSATVRVATRGVRDTYAIRRTRSATGISLERPPVQFDLASLAATVCNAREQRSSVDLPAPFGPMIAVTAHRTQWRHRACAAFAGGVRVAELIATECHDSDPPSDRRVSAHPAEKHADEDRRAMMPSGSRPDPPCGDDRI